MEQRLLLAFVLMGLVLFLTPYFYKAPPPAAQDNGLGHRGPERIPLPRQRRPRQQLPRRQRSAHEAAPTEPVPGQIAGSRRTAVRHRHRHLSRDAFQSRRNGAQLDSEEISRQARQAAGIGQRSQLFQSGAAVFHRAAGRQSRRRVELRPLRGQAGRRTAWASSTSSPMARTTRRKRSSFQRPATFRRSRPKSPSTAFPPTT